MANREVLHGYLKSELTFQLNPLRPNDLGGVNPKPEKHSFVFKNIFVHQFIPKNERPGEHSNWGGIHIETSNPNNMQSSMPINPRTIVKNLKLPRKARNECD